MMFQLRTIFLAFLLGVLACPLSAERQRLRVVSLSPILTEIAMALSLEERLVGVTALCDYPPRVQKKMKVGEYKPNPKQVQALEPTHIISMGRDKVLEIGLSSQPYLYKDFSSPNTAAEVFDLITEVGQAIGKSSEAEALIQKMTGQLQALRNLPAAQKKKRVAMILWHDPMLVIGSEGYLSDAIKLSGSKNIFESASSSFHPTSIKAILKRRPDHIICTRKATYDALRENLKLDRYLRKKKIQLSYIPENPILTRPGPRLPKLVQTILQ